ncbi:MAG: DUF2325 domain-containing protein [Anaerovoracaceae bacterium]|jgi:hypothetical protein
MSVVIVGGNDRMVRQYKSLCEEYNCNAKVFTQMSNGLKKNIGNPDMVVLFTNTVSHKMIHCATSKIKGSKAIIARAHSSSLSALRAILEEHAPVEA